MNCLRAHVKGRDAELDHSFKSLKSRLSLWLSGKKKNLPANTGDVGLIPGSGRSPGEGNGNLLQYSCLENSMVRGAWWFTVHGVAELDTA